MRGDKQLPTRPHEFWTELFMAPELKKQAVMSLLGGHCLEGKLPSVAEVSKGAYDSPSDRGSLAFSTVHLGSLRTVGSLCCARECLGHQVHPQRLLLMAPS